MFTDRKSSYKLPPTTIRDKLISQEARRKKALEEQRRRRAQRVDSARQLDILAELNIGATDDEDEPEEDEISQNLALAPASVAPYAPLLTQDQVNAITSSERDVANVSNIVSHPPVAQETESKKKSKKRKNKRRTNKPSKWADKCMYAELLEMTPDEPWSHVSLPEDNDGLPKDLETGWVAVGPVPAGKRCLAVTHQSAGVAGVVPNTTLRSRLLGKTLIQRFPSSLPPLTILDCILDANWRDNGILHILDVVKWKGQDVGECEANFRFWWRDTRLTELGHTLPPPTSINSRSQFVPVNPQDRSDNHTLKYRFPYPTTFIPVPYHTNTTLTSLDGVIVPAARTVREVDVTVPLPPLPSQFLAEANGDMDVEPLHGIPPVAIDSTPSPSRPVTFAPHPSAKMAPSQTLRTCIQPDGLLLYVAEASYEPGTSPLSSWVPITAYDQKDHEYDDGLNDHEKSSRPVDLFKSKESPLDVFQRLVKKRLASKMAVQGPSFVQQVVDLQSSSNATIRDVEMDFQ